MMAGSGGGSDYGTRGENTRKLREQAQREVQTQEFLADVNIYLTELLSAFNDRDTGVVSRRLDEAVEALGEQVENVDRLLFGGSIAKHTFVSGLSDVDALVFLRGDQPSDPSELVSSFADALRGALTGTDIPNVEPGNLAVTLMYDDGTKIQLLPAVEKAGRIAIPSEDGGSWRDVRPRKFAEKLTRVNQANGRGVVPAIKLAKALLTDLPESQRLSGYHIEAIAVDAFRRYEGPQSREAMLRHLLAHTSRTVRRPTGDITGQSVHIDSHLGEADSSQRLRTSTAIRRIVSRMDSARSLADYKELFGDRTDGTLF